MIRLACLLMLVAAASCTQIRNVTDTVAERTVGNPARTVIQPAIEAQVGDAAQAQRITDCVIEYATPGELTRIAADATSIEGPAPDITLLIADILSRPATSQCAAGAA
ncbi:hypothetical protein [Roseisalinus antarcticus]|uniref:Succinate dehydrogenase flavoprotein subunit n=1 Tax=Roseisalinus antarcticus TaxID=254357 RepID=A0A1Y5RQW9_9RHOB|nr:hypothetical protein [Roseisalinus antarcticus]SLN23245.1 hypothetical protein ROA7023_00693 [Roseisalinus antarcticus]